MEYEEMSSAFGKAASSLVSRRSLLKLVPAGLGVMALSACTGGPSVSNGGGAAAPSSSAADYKGVKPAASIEFWSTHPGSSIAIETALVKAYNASQSETTVKLVTAGANYAEVAQRFQTALASNKVPALVMVADITWFQYVINGQTAPMEPLAAAVGLDTGDYVKTFYDDYLYGSRHWAVPYARSTPLFYYNKDHFHTAGLPDRAPKTWLEMDDFAKKLKAANLGTSAVYNYALPTNYLSWYSQNLVWAWGGNYSTNWDFSPLTGSGTVAALEWAAKTMKSRGGWAGVTSNSQTDDLAAGATSTALDSTGTLQHLSSQAHFKLGAGFLPGGPAATDHVCPTGGAGISIPAKSTPEEQIAAIKFLKWLTNPENTVKFCGATGYLPVRSSANTSSLTAKVPLVQESLDQLQHLRSQARARVFITIGDLTIGNGIGEVLLKNADPKSTMEGVKQKLDSYYNQNVKPLLSKQGMAGTKG